MASVPKPNPAVTDPPETNPAQIPLSQTSDRIEPLPGSVGPDFPAEEPIGPASQTDVAAEVDLWWGSYSGRALMPGIVAALLLSLIIAGVAFYEWLIYDLPKLPVRYSAYALIGLVWAVFGLRAGHLLLTNTYRLTTRRVWRERPLINIPADRHLELTQITSVILEKKALQKLLRIGQIRLVADPKDEGLVLDGVFRPDHVAALIRKEVERARNPSRPR
jgi:hypothetical protein